ncbi:ty3-gypsy retrotransposon protein [Cucumis melo var. makuwa]|uniref:Ty3-gypsy retrotransposon protein n=1 Tax=Cucumis melo var. makuwa TaxID=1194695 RepID=A0A5A7UDQ7_CUCMM|nr:ty3-gypsy retrotransposon protein [Cucumis melo var. makuwa]
MKPNVNYATSENKGNTTFPMRTITLRSSNTGEACKEGPMKRLLDAEFQARKEKGLCFKCNEKYSADHKCKRKEQWELRMFVVVNENEEYEIIEENEAERKELTMFEIRGDNATCLELSLNSLVGLNDLGTMKLVKKLQLPAKETPQYGVILGSGTTIQDKGNCEALEVQMSEWTVKEDLLPLELGGVDIILGMQWLYLLGVIVVD